MRDMYCNKTKCAFRTEVTFGTNQKFDMLIYVIIINRIENLVYPPCWERNPTVFPLSGSQTWQ